MKKSLIMMLTIAAISMVVLGGCVDIFSPKATDPVVVQVLYTYFTNNYSIKSNVTTYNLLVQKNITTNFPVWQSFSPGLYLYSDADLKHAWVTLSMSQISASYPNTSLSVSTNAGNVVIANACPENPLTDNVTIKMTITYPKEISITNYRITKK